MDFKWEVSNIIFIDHLSQPADCGYSKIGGGKENIKKVGVHVFSAFQPATQMIRATRTRFRTPRHAMTSCVD